MTNTPHARAASKRAARALTLTLALLVSLSGATHASAQAARDARAQQTDRRAASPANPTRPRLVLLIAVDQFRYDYLERFGDLFAPNGLRRLLRDGASWSRADYDHIPTETAPGHATMMTGAWPAETGIVGNIWFDRDTGKLVTNSFDPSSNLLGGGAQEASSSPRRLLASTVGDELKLASRGRSKVVGVSIKDRSAILPAGRLADAAYWFSSQTGRFVSSTYYFTKLPDWVERFNAARPADKYLGARWERLLPDEAEYIKRAGPDDLEWENQDAANNKDTRTFPHVVTGGMKTEDVDAVRAGRGQPAAAFYDAVNYTPFSNEMLLAFAKEAITNERLGEDAETDVLTVSFSANDLAGHRFGPYSQEAMDITLRVDREIGALLDFVDQRVGLRNTVVVFTADHGVAPPPEQAASINLPGGRVKIGEITQAVRNAIRARYGKPGAPPEATDDYVLTDPNDTRRFAVMNHSIYFNPVALARDGVNQEELERVAGDAALKVPGVGRYFTRTQLLRGAVSPADPVARRALHGFNPRRAGDVILVLEPFKYLGEGTITATHGTPYSYDTHVPVVIMGAGVAPGLYREAATPADIAPTLAAILRVQPPSNAVGRVLVEALK